MQDIVFYVAANETLGLVRDYANMHRADAPVLTIGVAACLRMRLFADINVSTPYPVTSFSGITDWRWSMDVDFDRSTACKLVADEGGISVHTVTDTVNGETRSFTEVVIPISNMNTQELAAWLGNDGTKSGLTGELVGYDNNGNAIFVLQVENFTVRNRVAGLCDPTAVDEGIVTRSVAEQMIQTAVFSLAATKQDKLTASNGGTGISVTSTGIISVSNVPQSAVTGLSASLAGKQNALAFGWGLDHDYLDDVLSLARYRTVYSPTGATVTIVPGEAYKINAAASAKMIEAASIPDNTWGLEGHLEIFVAGTGYVQTGENVFLANALKPDAVNNCTVRFHDGYAIISVEDHIAGYIVMVNATSGSGSLNYALGVSTEYISVDASLNGQTLDLAGAVTNGEKHVVGNGYTETIISGGINCTSKTTLSNLAADGVIVSSGTLTLGDVFIPSGSTVAVSGGGLAIEKVTGNGGVIDLGGTNLNISYGASAVIDGCIFNGNSVTSGNVILCAGALDMIRCEFTGNTVPAGGAIEVATGSSFRAESCTITGNSPNDIRMDAGTMYFAHDTIGKVLIAAGELIVSGSNTIHSVTGGGQGQVTLTSGAILDLTGNTNATPIAPGGGIVFESGGATVLYSSGAVSGSYTMDNVTLPAGVNLTNTNVIDLNGRTDARPLSTDAVAHGLTFVGCSQTYGSVAQNAAYLSGCTFSSCAGNYGVVYCGSKTTTLENCKFVSCTANVGQIVAETSNAYIDVSSCSIPELTKRAAYISLSAKIRFTDCELGNIFVSSGMCEFNGSNSMLSKVEGSSGTVTLTSGAVLDLTGNTNATPIAPGGGITFAPGGATVLTGATAGVVDAQYSMDNVTLPAGAKLTNTNVVDFGGGPGITNNANITASASGCTLRGALATTGACDIYGSIAFTDCTIESNYVGSGGSAREIRLATGSASFNGCTIGSGGIIVAETGGTMSFAGNNTILGKGVVAAGTASATVTISSGASINLTNSIINPGGTGGITVLTGGCTVNGNAIPAGTYTSIDSNGQPT